MIELTQRRMPSDIVGECLDRYSTGNRIRVEECFELFEKTGDYNELVYAIIAMVNQAGFTRDIWTPLKLGTEYIYKNLNTPEVGEWKNTPVDEYLEEIKALAEGKCRTDEEMAKFVACCLCAAWVVKHGGKAA